MFFCLSVTGGSKLMCIATRQLAISSGAHFHSIDISSKYGTPTNITGRMEEKTKLILKTGYGNFIKLRHLTDRPLQIKTI